MAGFKFYGGSTPCGACGSQVKSLWWVFLEIPIVPMGCYRHLAPDSGDHVLFWARRTAMDWPQVFRAWIWGLLFLTVSVSALVWYLDALRSSQ